MQRGPQAQAWTGRSLHRRHEPKWGGGQMEDSRIVALRRRHEEDRICVVRRVIAQSTFQAQGKPTLARHTQARAETGRTANGGFTQSEI